MLDFTTMDINTIATGVRGDGVRYLQLFWQEYTSIFNEKVNPGCSKCLTTCVSKYKNHFKKMASETQYRLKPKYENIPLEFGSAILVNNNNITEEYAKKLLARPNGERFFVHIPAETEPVAEQPKRKRKTVKKKPLQNNTAQETNPETEDTDALPNPEIQ